MQEQQKQNEDRKRERQKDRSKSSISSQASEEIQMASQTQSAEIGTDDSSPSKSESMLHLNKKTRAAESPTASASFDVTDNPSTTGNVADEMRDSPADMEPPLAQDKSENLQNESNYRSPEVLTKDAQGISQSGVTSTSRQQEGAEQMDHSESDEQEQSHKSNAAAMSNDDSTLSKDGDPATQLPTSKNDKDTASAPLEQNSDGSQGLQPSQTFFSAKPSQDSENESTGRGSDVTSSTLVVENTKKTEQLKSQIDAKYAEVWGEDSGSPKHAVPTQASSQCIILNLNVYRKNLAFWDR